MATITGGLHHTDYGDNEERDLEAGSYDYTLTVDGDGKLGFKVERRELTDNGARWVTIEEKSKVRGGTVLTGDFFAAETVGGQTEVRFNFNREFLSSGVDYTLEYAKR